MVGISPEKAIKLAVNDYSRLYWTNHLGLQSDEDLPLKYGILSGATAGFCQVIVTNPMEIVKINMQLSSTSSSSTLETATSSSNLASASPIGAQTTVKSQPKSTGTMDVVRNLGLRGLYKGTLATLCRDVPFSFLFFPSLAVFKSLAPKDPVTNQTPFSWIFGSGILAGACASAAVTPMDGKKFKSQYRSVFVSKFINEPYG